MITTSQETFDDVISSSNLKRDYLSSHVERVGQLVIITIGETTHFIIMK